MSFADAQSHDVVIAGDFHPDRIGLLEPDVPPELGYVRERTGPLPSKARSVHRSGLCANEEGEAWSWLNPVAKLSLKRGDSTKRIVQDH
jgi:hypothetical protein